MSYPKNQILNVIDELFDDAERDYGAPGLPRQYVRMNAAARIFDQAPSEWSKVLNEISDVISDEEGAGNLQEEPDPNTGTYMLKRIGNKAKPQPTTGAKSASKPFKPIGNPINNHVCPTCSNDRVSKSESNCWKCGNKL